MGAYRGSERVHMRALSFRILMHAEIESFIEDRASELGNAGWAAWHQKRLSNDVVLGLLSYSGVELMKAPGKLGGDPANQKAYEDMAIVLEKANRVWRHDLKNNHGIKEANVLSMLLPLGISANSLDATLLADLSSYGTSRGEAAHKSPYSATVQADPKDEYEKARQLVADLGKIDEVIALALDRISRLVRVFP